MQLNGLLSASVRNAALHLKHTHGLGLAVLSVVRLLREYSAMKDRHWDIESVSYVKATLLY